MLGTSEGYKEVESRRTVCQSQTQELALTTKIKKHPWVRYLERARPSSLFCLLVSFLPPTGRTYQEAASKGICLRVWATPQRGEQNPGLGLRDAAKYDSPQGPWQIGENKGDRNLQRESRDLLRWGALRAPGSWVQVRLTCVVVLTL